MKTYKTYLTILAIVIQNFLSAQDQNSPLSFLYNTQGQEINASKLTDGTEQLIVVCWKNSDAKSLDQVEEVYAILANYQRDLKVIAVCLDQHLSGSYIQSMAHGNNLVLEIYFNRNGEFSRRMNILNEICTLMFDENMNFLHQFSAESLDQNLKAVLLDKSSRIFNTVHASTNK